MIWQEAQLELRKSLGDLYEAREASQITEWIMEHISGMPRIERMMIERDTMNTNQIESFNECKKALLEGKPVQYITGYSWFLGNKYQVNEKVLIPRPETEQLVQMIYEENKDRQSFSILDIGTGSGCIPVALKLLMPSAAITSLDISEEALRLAQKNATLFQADVQFLHKDLFDEKGMAELQNFDIIVSNPPYISISEKEEMDLNVVQHEPHIALFVPDKEPLIFYKAIAQLATQKLKAKGCLYFETHFKYAEELKNYLLACGFQANVIQDIFGKDRFVKSEIKEKNKNQ